MVYMYHPELDNSQVLLFRSITASIITALYVNKDLKNVMYDSVKKEDVPILSARVSVSVAIRFCVNLSLGFFKLTTVAIVTNMTPSLILLFGFLFL